MRVIDVEKYPRGAIHYIRYLAARRCPRCGKVLTYFYDKPPVTLPEGGRATLVELRCPRCDLPPVDVFAVPQVGRDEDVVEENFHCEMEYIADVVLTVQARAAEKVEGITLREGKRSRKGA